MTEADHLIAMADAEIAQLRVQLAALQAELAETKETEQRTRRAVEELAAENADLYGQMRAATPRPPTPLTGLRIGIIGHPSREQDYRHVVERLGGRLVFASASDKFGLIDRVVQKAHGTLYLTAWGSHKGSERAWNAAVRYDRPMLLCEQPGLASVERVLVEKLLPLIHQGA